MQAAVCNTHKTYYGVYPLYLAIILLLYSTQGLFHVPYNGLTVLLILL